MGSSKIQSRNIDPSADIAKESSVQEVLSAVGNNRIVQDDLIYRYSYYSTSEIDKTVLSVTGKGRLHGAICTGSIANGAFTRITITVDGYIIYDRKFNYSNSSYSARYYLGVANKDFVNDTFGLKGVQMPNNIPWTAQYTDRYFEDIGFSEQLYQATLTKAELNGITNDSLLLLGKSIEFNNSFSIYISANGTGAHSCVACYALDEVE